MGVVIAAAAVASAQSAPSLPRRSAAQLLAEVAGANARALGPLTATIQQTSNLGFPALPTPATEGSGPAAVLTSGRSVSIWYLDAQHIRVAVPVPSGESDLRLDGRTLWLWNSKTQTATHVALPAHVPSPNGAFPGVSSSAGSGSEPPGMPVSPLAAAKKLLAAIGPSTAVGVQRNVYVAGRAAYQLSVVPRTSGSLVGQILIAIDASTHIPLRVQVYARGRSSPAFAIGFTALTFGRPAMSNFSFTPPPGATVKQETVPTKVPASLGKLGLGRLARNKLAMVRPIPARLRLERLRLAKMCLAKSGIPTRKCAAALKLSVINLAPTKLAPSRRLPKQVIRRIEQSFANSLPKNMPAAQRAKIIKGFDQQFSNGSSAFSSCINPGPGSKLGNNGGAFCPAGAVGSSEVIKNLGNNGGGFFNGPLGAIGLPADALPAGAKPTIIGKDWLTVVATQPNPAVAAAIEQLLARPGKGGSTQQGSSTSSASSSTGISITLTTSPAPVGPDPALVHALLLATKAVHGKWGSGRLLTTSLLSVLITSNGRILAGAVTPAVLYHDAATRAG
ncbi:MAG TPA: hypothetical protein VGI66_01360 [Streptosporangiaceae bacterium]